MATVRCAATCLGGIIQGNHEGLKSPYASARLAHSGRQGVEWSARHVWA
jgi:hypothetical protein